MDFVLLLLFLYIALCCKPCPAGDLSSRAMLPVRGLCAVGIIFHHVCRYAGADSTLVFRLFDFMGSVLVSMFFAISGYALSAQYARNGSSYLSGFLQKRMAALFVPYGVYLLLYGSLHMALGKTLSLPSSLLPIDSSLVLYSWYVAAIACFYLIYYLARQLGRKKPWVFATVLAAGMLLYVLGCQLLGFGIWWYNSILAFPFGMVYFQGHRAAKLANPWLSTGAALGVFGISLALRLKLLTDGIPGLAMDALIALSFPLLVFSFLRKFSIRSRILDWLGSRSYEIYLAQGIPILLLRSGLAEVTSPLVFCGITVLGALLIAEGVYRLDRRLLKLAANKKACC